MGYKEFAQVFAPSSAKVEAKRDEHYKNAKGWIVVDIILMLGLAGSIFLAFNDFGDFFAKEMATEIALYGVLLLVVALLICVAVTWRELSKAAHLEKKLNNEYLLSGEYSRNRYYF